MADNLTLAERAKRFLAQHGGVAEAAVSALLRDNKKLRDERRTLREQSPYRPDENLQRENAELQAENERLSGLIPAAGSVVLSGDDAAAWPKLKALNLSADKLTELVREHGTLAARIAERDRQDVVARVAETMKWKPATLQKIAAAEGLHLEFKDVSETKDGKTTKVSVPHVRLAKDEKAALEPLKDFAARELKDYLPALRAAEGGADEEEETTEAGGVEYIEQSNSSRPAAPSREKLAAAARATGDYAL